MKNNIYKMKEKKASVGFILVTLAIVVVTITSVTFVALRSLSKNSLEKSYIATVNGDPVSIEEFRHMSGNIKASVFDYFSKKYGVQDSEKFWSSSYGGEVPIELVKKKALEECIKLRVQYALAKREGIVEDTTYKAFLKSLDEENARRREAVAKKQVVYGPVQYDADTYLKYVLGNISTHLKEKLKEKQLKPEEYQLRQYYETNKDKYFKTGKSVKIQVVSVGFVGMNRDVDEGKKQEAYKKIQEAKKRSDNGEGFEGLMKMYNNKGEQRIYEIIEDDRRTNVGENLRKIAFELKDGQVSEIINNVSTFDIVRCIEKKDEIYQRFEEVKDTVKASYIDWRYCEFINQLVKDAQVSINEEAYAFIDNPNKE